MTDSALPAALDQIRVGLKADEAKIGPEHCGCLDASHRPPCVPQPWRERALREIAAKREILALCETETDGTGGRPLAVRILFLLADIYASPAPAEGQAS